MTLKLYDWNEATRSLRDLWISLLNSGGLNPSLHPDWLAISMTAKGLLPEAKIAFIEGGGGSVAIVPVIFHRQVVSGMPMRCIDLCSNYMSYHAELPASGGLEELLLEMMASRELPPWDVVRMDNLVAGGATVSALDNLAALHQIPALTYAAERSPYIRMSMPWPDYLQSLSRKMRANISRCIRSTQQAGETAMAWYERGSDVERLLADILEVESRSWKATENTAIRAATTEGTYHRMLLPWLEQNGLMANVLYIADRPAAYVLCSQWNGWIGQLKTSFAQDVRDAGFRVIHASIERAFGYHAREYDFLGDAAPHKLRWADQIRAHENRWLFARHWRGRALYALKRSTDDIRRRLAERRAPPDEATPE